ncbi:ABC transporter substrate-binding protein [Bacillus thermotolerans]|uniref:ABC-type sulfate transporter, periplasmic binding protein n=1 Tax=Bacillus thermotolerans TaxID=1221996 RepID=A0A0F5IBD0_BACTR|nr:aliphatic sulfonate ABC transporter substrate-binding protein [Bacillus thermotolerans]KKB39143.1 putative ABC-type sulfate transporter, periplasmic binding protein [Bacillus thermotolerans]KKB41570.1 putative ABC-type sulfate transporter, periplasmic binding protein [Bacillus thermotolerans]KKB42763.1 putative ABC-type sulfate transporter, periplasmic binding protein [Bacillus thermotolerans]
MKKKIGFLSVLFLLAMGLLAACGSGEEEAKKKVVIGYFPNLDHVPAMIAKEKGYYEEALGDDVDVEYKTFPDGGAFMVALKTGDVDAGLVGPGPVMNNYTNGADVKIVAGGSSGGTVIVARNGSGIESVEDFDGKTFITPGVGCTHDVQMETFIKDYGLESNRIGGTLKHTTGKPAQYAGLFESGRVDLAAVPEPWGSLLVKEEGAKIIVDSDEISYGTTLPNSVLATNGKLVEEDPELVQKIVNAHQKAIDFINGNPEEAKELTIASIKADTNQELAKDVVDSAWERITYTSEVNEEVVQQFANSSYDLKFLKEQPDFTNLIDQQFVKK